MDTNVVSYLFRETAWSIGYRELLRRPTGITVLSLAELHFGAACNGWGQEKLLHLDELLSEFHVMPTPAVIAQVCGSLRAARRCVGRPIELADAWIAATALWFDVPVVTHDRDFEAIPGLRVLTMHNRWSMRDSGGIWDDWSESFYVRDEPRRAETTN